MQNALLVFEIVDYDYCNMTFKWNYHWQYFYYTLITTYHFSSYEKNYKICYVSKLLVIYLDFFDLSKNHNTM